MFFYKFFLLVLETIQSHNINDFQTLVHAMEPDETVMKSRVEAGDQSTIAIIENILVNLIEDGLVSGTVQPTEDGDEYEIKGLTEAGIAYLEIMKNPATFEQVRQLSQDSNVPITLTTLTRLIGKTFTV